MLPKESPQESMGLTIDSIGYEDGMVCCIATMKSSVRRTDTIGSDDHYATSVRVSKLGEAVRVSHGHTVQVNTAHTTDDTASTVRAPVAPRTAPATADTPAQKRLDFSAAFSLSFMRFSLIG